jgi:hypothetical protein
MSKIALVIIYNHKYEQNIDKLEFIYSKKFSNIYHLVPFYSGSKINVISVFENSFYFQGYIAQGLKYFFKDEFQHYLFIGDDLLLNPLINEDNYDIHFNVTDNSSFLPELINLHDCNKETVKWERVKDVFHFKPEIYGLEIKNEIPDKNKARELFAKHNLSLEPFTYSQITPPPLEMPNKFSLVEFFDYCKDVYRRLKYKNHEYFLHYPLVGGYSDIILVSKNDICLFAHYAGVFACSHLFVEFAIPTAMVLSAKSIVTEKSLKLKGMPMWTNENLDLLNKYNFNLDFLLHNFPDEYLYIHPIKLSKWGM